MSIKLYVTFFVVCYHAQVLALVVKQIALNDFCNIHPNASVKKCTDNYSFNMHPFPLYSNADRGFFPETGIFRDVFILEIPNGKAYFEKDGYVFLNDYFIKEFQIKHLNFFNNCATKNIVTRQNIIKKQGRVAIVTHLYPYCYGHWIFDVVGQLALLEMHNIEYDYICIPYYLKFMQETLDLWGIDKAKIIPMYLDTTIVADTIIIPSPVTQTKTFAAHSNYNMDFIVQYVRKKLLSNIKNLENNHSPKKIFLSRKDAKNKRAVLNEDEIFALFQEQGYQRFELGKLSQEEQISLFYNAKYVVSFVGSSATNIMYCQPGTCFIEIFQTMMDATFFYLSDMVDLQYYYINGLADPTKISSNPWSKPISMPVHLVKEFLSNCSDL